MRMQIQSLTAGVLLEQQRYHCAIKYYIKIHHMEDTNNIPSTFQDSQF